jgi:hypothetical protein
MSESKINTKITLPFITENNMNRIEVWMLIVINGNRSVWVNMDYTVIF